MQARPAESTSYANTIEVSPRHILLSIVFEVNVVYVVVNIPSSTNNNDDEVAAVIQRAHDMFESSDCRSNDATVIDHQISDIEKCLADIQKCLAEEYCAHAASRSS